ncbi:hypothetical protein GZH46_02985, partial [Fragariocoptes setiger]
LFVLCLAPVIPGRADRPQSENVSFEKYKSRLVGLPITNHELNHESAEWALTEYSIDKQHQCSVISVPGDRRVIRNRRSSCKKSKMFPESNINKALAKLDTAILAMYQFASGEDYRFSRVAPHRVYFPRALIRLAKCFKFYFLIKTLILTQLAALIIQLERNEFRNSHTWWHRVYIPNECSFASAANCNGSQDCLNVERVANCSRVILFGWLDIDPHEIIRAIGDPVRLSNYDGITLYCLVSTMTFVMAVVVPVAKTTHRLTYRNLEYAFNPQQTLREQARCIYKHQVLLKHLFYYNNSQKRFDYNRSRPYARSHDWLVWSVRVRVVITSIGQFLLTVPLITILLVAFTLNTATTTTSASNDNNGAANWRQSTWQDWLFIVELSVQAVLLTLVIGSATVYLLFPIIELSFWLDEIRLRLCTATLLARYSCEQLHQAIYWLTSSDSFGITDNRFVANRVAETIHARQLRAISDDCRIKSLPHFVRIFKLNTRKQYQQLIIQCAAANYAHTIDKLLDDIYFDLYLFVYEFEFVNELVSLVTLVTVVTLALITAMLLYLSQYLSDFDSVVSMAMGLTYVVGNSVLIASSYVSSRLIASSFISQKSNIRILARR